MSWNASRAQCDFNRPISSVVTPIPRTLPADASAYEATLEIATGSDAPDVDIAGLLDRGGQDVRIAGLVAELRPNGFVLDDGTGKVEVVLQRDADLY